MDIIELNEADTLKFTEDVDFVVPDHLEPEETDLSLVEVEFSESREHSGTSRASGYTKTSSDDTVGAFFKEMARYPLLKPEEEVELANSVQFLVEIDELQENLQKQLGHKPTKLEIAKAVNLTERQLEQSLVSRASRETQNDSLKLAVGSIYC
jgi:RNA polymerase primary sigma factor